MTTLLSCRDLTVSRGGRQVLRGVSLDLRRGELTVLIGPNGAGKSTLLAVLGGLLVPDSGRLERGGRVGTALQAPALATRSVLANVELALAWWGTPRGREPRRAQALAALVAMGAAYLADQAAVSLSGGEARRVHIARALAVRPDVLLLDEPFAGLDPSTRADLMYDAEHAFRSPERAVLVVVHDRAEAWAMADRVLVLIDGRVQADGTPSEVFDHPQSEQVAEFVGFTGRVDTGDGVLRVRCGDVVLDADGPLRGRVRRRVPVQDGVRLDVEVAGGRVEVLTALPGPAAGDEVRLRVARGLSFAPASPRPVSSRTAPARPRP